MPFETYLGIRNVSNGPFETYVGTLKVSNVPFEMYLGILKVSNGPFETHLGILNKFLISLIPKIVFSAHQYERTQLLRGRDQRSGSE